MPGGKEINMLLSKTKPAAYLAALVISFSFLPQILLAATQVSQFGITWTFDKDYTVGQFANGDYYVVGPVTVTGINPPSATVSGWTKNGSMVNPTAGMSQGYDSSQNFWVASLNKGLTMPLVIPAGSSLISTISVSTSGASQSSQLQSAAILTVLSSAPSAGSFRPPYCGTNKTIKFNKSQLDYTKLANLASTPSQPRLAQQTGDAQADSVERMFERPWIDHIESWAGEYFHPTDTMPMYGRDLCDQMGTAALMLHLNFTNAQKETLMIRFVQLGIDNYGIIVNGGQDNWDADGGHASGRKWPILFAGIVLNDPDMKAVGTTTKFPCQFSPYPAFGEDLQTFYVAQSDINLKGHQDGDGQA